MSRLNKLLKERGELVDKFAALDEKATKETRDFTPEEHIAFDELEADIKKLDEMIERVKKVEAIKAASAKPIDMPGDEQRKVPAQPKRFRAGKLKAFKGANAEEDAYRSGMFLRATLMKDISALDWCRENGVIVTRAQSESVNTAGGYLVIPEFERAIIDLREEFGMFRSEVRLMPMGSDSVSIPRRTGGVTAYWTAEGAEITASDKTWGQIQLVAKKLAALTRMSTELNEDAMISVADDLAAEMAYAFAVEEDRVGWNGTGIATDGGITGVRTRINDGTHTASVVAAASTNDTFAEINATDLSNVMAKLPKFAERSAKWYVSQVGWSLVFQRLAQASGGTTMGEVTGGKPSRAYMGYPVVIDQTLPTVTTALNAVPMLFFGDLSLACRMGERRGVTIKSTEERYFEFDQIGIQATERIDINAHDLGSTTVAGPIIALNGTT